MIDQRVQPVMYIGQQIHVPIIFYLFFKEKKMIRFFLYQKPLIGVNKTNKNCLCQHLQNQTTLY